MKTFIGIDPGQSGGIAIIEESKISVFPMPILKDGNLDTEKIIQIFIYSDSNDIHIVIENVHSIFGSSAKSNFSFGYGCGKLQGIIETLKIPYTKVDPKTWQKEMWQGVKPVLINTGKKTKSGEIKYKTDTKATSLIACKRLFPNVDLRASDRCKKDNDGIVDSLLLALYGKRKGF